MAAPAIRPESHMTLAQFLWWEREQPFKYEFVDGVVRAMTGTTERHNVLADNVHATLRGPAKVAGCRSYFTDLQVRTPSGRVYYPDVVVGCGPRDPSDRHVRTPCLIVEITSPSTQHVDEGEKLEAYRAMPALRAYLVVHHTARRVECHVRDGAGAWSAFEMSDARRVHEFATPCIEAVLSLDEIYADTDLVPPGPDLAADELPPDE